MTTHKRYLTTSDVAARLGLSRYTILRAVERGDLAIAGRTPAGWARFEPAEVAAYARRLLAHGHGRQALRAIGGADAEPPPARRPEEALRQSEERFRALFEHATDLIAVVDARGLIRYASPSYERVLGYAPGGLEGTLALDLTHPDERARVLGALRQRAEAPGSTGKMEFRVRHADGSWRILDVTTANRLHDPAVRGIITTARDVSDRVRAEEALRQSEERLRAVITNAPVILFALDAHGVYTLSEGKGLEALGRAPGQVVGQSAFDVYAHAPHLQEALRRTLAGEPTSAVVENGGVVIDARHTPLLDEDGRVRGVIGVGADITARVRAEEALRHQALHDALTGLPNRTLLHDRLGHALQAATRDATPLALFLLDLDRFKEINDTLGHGAGDALLRHVAAHISGALRASDTIARLGGDEFAVLLPGADAARAAHTARKLLSILTAPVEIEGQCFAAAASIGIALHPDHGADAATLLRYADIAMYAAKRAGGGHAVYSAELDQHTPWRLTLITALHRAIAHDELRLHYQPTIDATSSQVRMVEALVRWQHPERGLLLPDEFIPLAEQTGLIVPLTRWVLEAVVRQVRAWRDDGLDLGAAVNLSARVLHDPDLPATIAALLDAHAVPAAWLRIELTESAVMADPAGALDVLTRLAGLGVRITIDDFGAGYSSLAYLKRLPVDEIKIDKSFVTDMLRDADIARLEAEGVSRSEWAEIDNILRQEPRIVLKINAGQITEQAKEPPVWVTTYLGTFSAAESSVG